MAARRKTHQLGALFFIDGLQVIGSIDAQNGQFYTLERRWVLPTRGHFFSVSPEVIDLIAAQTNWEDALLGYVVLSRYTRPKTRMTTAGAPAIAKSLGMTTHRADEVIRALSVVRCGKESHETALVRYRDWVAKSETETTTVDSRYPGKVLPHYGEGRIYLPNSLVEGVGGGKNSPPLYKLRQILPKQDRVDAVRLLLKLYQYHSYLDYGGVNPRLLCKPWLYDGEVLDDVKLGYLGSAEWQTQRLHFWLVSRAGMETTTVGKELVDGVMDGSAERFWTAFRHLQALHLLYEVAVVFDEDPVHSPRAEPLYPLYVWDRNIRDRAAQEQSGLGGLALEALNAFDRSLIPNEHDLRYCIYADPDYDPAAGSGVYVCSGDSEKARVVSVFRLKYLAPTQDVGQGVEGERRGAGYWKDLLDGAFRCIALPICR